MDNSNYYSADEGSDVYKDDDNNVVRTHPAEVEKKAYNKARKKVDEKIDKIKDDEDISSDYSSYRDISSDYSGYDILSSFMRALFFLLPVVIMVIIMFTIISSIDIASLTANTSTSLNDTLIGAFESQTAILEMFPLFLVIAFVFITAIIVFRVFGRPSLGGFV